MASSSALQPAIISEIEALQPRLPLQTLQENLKTLLDTLSSTLSQTTSFPSLQTRLQTASLSTTHLVERTRTTLSLFRAATQKNIDDITLTHHLLCGNLVTPAERMLSKSSDASARLAQNSNNLALAFEAAASELSDTLKEAYDTLQTQREKVEQLRQTTESSYANLSRARSQYTEASTKLCEASLLYESAERKEAAAQRRGNLLHAAHVSAIVASYLTTRSTALALSVTGVAAMAATSDQQAARAREERAVHLRHKNDARDERAAADIEVAEMGERLRSVKRESVVADSVLEGLEKCVMLLRELAGVMVVVEGFWKTVGERVDGGIVEMVTVGTGLPDEDRQAFWEGDRFRGRVDRVVEFWRAVGIVCQRGLDGVGNVAICDASQSDGVPPRRGHVGRAMSSVIEGGGSPEESRRRIGTEDVD